MNSENYQDARRHPRRTVLAGGIPLALYRPGFSKPVMFLAVDVSARGLGIVTDDAMLVSESTLYLEANGQRIAMRPCWCQPEDVKSKMPYRYGLECEDGSINLESIF